MNGTRFADAAMGLAFGAASGAVATLLTSATHEFDQIGDGATLFNTPKIIPIVYSIVLVGYFQLRLRISLGLQSLAIFAGVYVAWFCAIKTYEVLGAYPVPQGVAPGAVGAALTGLAVAAVAPGFRQGAALAAIAALGGACGLFLVFDLVSALGASEPWHDRLAMYPLFVSWQATTMATFGYFARGPRG